jgi:hypothetical protein
MMMTWLNAAGLVFNLLGAGVMAVSVIASRPTIERMLATGYGGPPNPDAVADRRRQSNLAILGLGLLFIGFLLQLIASWPR